MTEILLSVIVPVHNAAAYIPNLTAEFARQRSDALEVLFVDDGSSDESPALLARAALSGGNVRVITLPHGGVSAARNAGMARAAGRYLAFADADDMIAPDYVQTLLNCAARGGDLYVLRHSRVVRAEAAFDNLSGQERAASSEALLEMLLRSPTRFGVYDFVIRRKLIEEAGLQFPCGYPYYEDYDFALRLFDAARDARMIERCVYCYRAVPGSAMSTYSAERLRCLELFDAAHSQYLKRHANFYPRFRKWFVARLSWSVLWQAAVAMDACAALSFARAAGMRGEMKKLRDYPDRRVKWSARAYALCPRLAIWMMKARGKGRTLLARGD